MFAVTFGASYALDSVDEGGWQKEEGYSAELTLGKAKRPRVLVCERGPHASDWRGMKWV